MSYYAFTSTSLGNADEVMANFYHIYQGDRLPYTATASGTITASDNTVDLGSSSARWRTLYCNNVLTTIGAITAPYMWSLKSRLVLSGTASSIEFTSLSSIAADFIIDFCQGVFTTATTMLRAYMNNDSASSYYYTGFTAGPAANEYYQYNTATASIIMDNCCNGNFNIVIQHQADSTTVISIHGISLHSGNRPFTEAQFNWNGVTGTSSIKFIPMQSAGALSVFQPGTCVNVWGKN